MNLLVVFIGLIFSSLSFAAAYTPHDDGQVLEQLPTVATAVNSDLRQLRAALNAQPQQLELAVRLAQRYIALGKAEGDPRFYGYAQGVLQPWWDKPQTPSEVLLLRALILQQRHDFDSALQSLDALLRREPKNVGAWRIQAVIFLVRARYDEAQRSCLPLVSLDTPLSASTCLASVGSLTGQGENSYRFLQSALADAQQVVPEQQLWALMVLADMASRLGKANEAEHYFQQALQVQTPDVYLLAAYSDFLLDQHRPAEVVALLAERRRVDGLLLRLALAKQQLGDAQLADVVAELSARFAASRMRGEGVHQGDEARFTLDLLHHPEQAVPLAVSNWAAQREPKDARIVLEAALAAHNTAAAQPVLAFLAKTKLESVQLQHLQKAWANQHP